MNTITSLLRPLNKYAEKLFFLGLSLVIIGLLFSKVAVSIGSFVLLGNWLFTGNVPAKVRAYLNNKTALIISLVFFVHLLGMCYTTDLAYGLKDLRVKLPLLLFPLILSSSPRCSAQTFRRLQLLFLAAVVGVTLISTLYWIIGPDHYSSDKRNLSLFGSHIRLSLMICLAFFIGLLQLKQLSSLKAQATLFLLLLWLPTFLLLMEYLTGVVILSFVLLVYLTHSLKHQSDKRIPGISLLVLVIGLGCASWKVFDLYSTFAEQQLPKDRPFIAKTTGGEPYSYPDMYTANPARQNGYVVYQNIAWGELIRAWNTRSSINIDSTTQNNYPIKHVVLWFLTSKGLEKDSASVFSLTDDEIHAIENGTSNVLYMNRNGITTRLLETCWEINNYLRDGDFNGHSVAMRWEFWKTAVNIFKQHPFFGVGTGDIKAAFQEQYEVENSILTKKWRLRSHNQYLSFAVAFGVVGSLIILFGLAYPVFTHTHLLIFLLFSCIFFLSLISEDTIETQVGVTFYAFFNSFYLFSSPERVDSARTDK